MQIFSGLAQFCRFLPQNPEFLSYVENISRVSLKIGLNHVGFRHLESSMEIEYFAVTFICLLTFSTSG